MTTHRILGVALAVQAGLAVATWWPSSGRAAVEPRSLVTLDADDVTAVEITGRAADGDVPEPLRLVRGDEGWVIESLHGYPADEAKVDELLRDLLDVQVRAPVATKPTSHAALEVADDAFTRRVRLEAGGEAVELYVGASRGRAAHVRLGGEPLVYAAKGLSAWSIGDSGRSFLDTRWVDLDREQLATFAVANAHGAFTLEQGPDGWTATGVEAPLDADAVDELLRDLSSLRLREPVAREAAPDHGFADPVRVSWTLSDGSAGAYEVGAESDGAAFARKDGSPHVVRVAASAVEPAREARLEALLADAPGEP